MSGDIIQTCADALFKAESDRRPIAPLTDRYPELSVADAYGIQRFNAERRLRSGQKIVGHKIGLTSKAMQEQFNVWEPDYGHLLDAMVLQADQALDLGELINPRIEIEPAFVLGKSLRGPELDVVDVLRATDYVVICFEVIDTRFVQWRIKLQDTVADNGSSARVILGSKRRRPSDLVLDDLATELELDGVVVERGNTSEILGHPARGVAWLANRISEFGVGLDAGHVVLPGTCTRSHRIHGCGLLTGRIAGLGEISAPVIGVPAITSAVEP